MKTFISVFVIALIIVAVALLYIYSGFYDISASKSETGLTKWVLETTKDNSIAHHAKDIQVPPNLFDSVMVWNGFKHYEKGCGCHGTASREASKTFNPPPPHLPAFKIDLKPNELFWVIKNGIKMSAMPTFESRMSDDEIWETVAFVNKFPISEEDYASLTQRMKNEMNKTSDNKSRRK